MDCPDRVAYFEDRLSGSTKVEDPPAMLEAFGALRSSGAGLLVAAKRDRIARDVVVAATVTSPPSPAPSDGQPRMARPLVGAAKDQQLVVRLPSDLRARLERVREALTKRAGGVALVTSHLVRQVIERGLNSIERELGRK